MLHSACVEFCLQQFDYVHLTIKYKNIHTHTHNTIQFNITLYMYIILNIWVIHIEKCIIWKSTPKHLRISIWTPHTQNMYLSFHL